MSTMSFDAASPIAYPGTYAPGTAWDLYNQLIAGIPEDVEVRDYCLGLNWSYVEADCGMGVAFTTRGGGKRAFKADLRGMKLRHMAELAKSWCFEEASLGVAALNDAFQAYRGEIAARDGANIVVVGHFPHVTDIAEYANLTVLERNCRDGLDTPDPACEFVLPQADFAFITGVTFINKTAPRLLALSRDALTVMVGPSVVMSPQLFDYGVHELAGSVVADPERARFAVMNGAGPLFGEALTMASLKAK